MVYMVWESLPERFSNIEMDQFVVMPNHFHGIVVIHEVGHTGVDTVGVPLVGTPNRVGTRHTPTDASTLGEMIGAFKSITTHQYIQGFRQKGWPSFDGRLWQRNYWEHIIRSEESLNEIRRYIQNNPLFWAEDKLHPDMDLV